MDDTVYRCRLCDVMYHHPNEVIDIFTEEGEKSGVASKILYSSLILVTKDDPTSKYICKVCWGHLEHTVKFLNICRAVNERIVKTAINEPTFTHYRKNILNFLKIPVHYTFSKYTNINSAYSSIVNRLSNKSGNEENEIHALNMSTPNSVHNKIDGTSSESNRFDQTNMSGVTNLSTEKSNTGTNGDNLNNTANGMLPTCLADSDITSNKTNVVLNTLRSKMKSKIGPGNSIRISTNKNGHKIFDEVICLDDDDDDDEENNDQPVENNNVQVVNKWIMQTVLNNNMSIQNVSKRPKNSTRTYVQRKSPPSVPIVEHAISVENPSTSSKNSVEESNVHNPPPRCISRLSNVSTEEISVTPDIEPLNMNPVFLLNQPKVLHPRYVYVLTNPKPNPPPQVLPETGFHFLSSFCTPDPPTVDLTSSDTPTKKPKPVQNKRKATKNCKSGSPPKKKNCSQEVPINNKSKAIIIKSSLKKGTNETVSKLRSRRTSEIEKLNLQKLGHQLDTTRWKVMLEIPSSFTSEYECPICLKCYRNPSIRLQHEKKYHSSPPVPGLSIKSSCPLENTAVDEKLEFFNYLKLSRMSTNRIAPKKKSVTNQLAKRKEFLNAVNVLGPINGLYECKLCKYTTFRMYLLWAHISVNHNFESNSCDSRSNSFCFICERLLSKRTQLLKHIDKCLIKQSDGEEKDSVEKDCEEKEGEEMRGIDCVSNISPVEKFACDYCEANDFDLLSLDIHLWNHAAS